MRRIRFVVLSWRNEWSSETVDLEQDYSIYALDDIGTKRTKKPWARWTIFGHGGSPLTTYIAIQHTLYTHSHGLDYLFTSTLGVISMNSLPRSLLPSPDTFIPTIKAAMPSPGSLTPSRKRSRIDAEELASPDKRQFTLPSSDNNANIAAKTEGQSSVGLDTETSLPLLLSLRLPSSPRKSMRIVTDGLENLNEKFLTHRRPTSTCLRFLYDQIDTTANLLSLAVLLS
jgi:hypothetical protein